MGPIRDRDSAAKASPAVPEPRSTAHLGWIIAAATSIALVVALSNRPSTPTNPVALPSPASSPLPSPSPLRPSATPSLGATPSSLPPSAAAPARPTLTGWFDVVQDDVAATFVVKPNGRCEGVADFWKAYDGSRIALHDGGGRQVKTAVLEGGVPKTTPDGEVCRFTFDFGPVPNLWLYKIYAPWMPTYGFSKAEMERNGWDVWLVIFR